MIGLFNDSFPPIMDGVAMTTYNYAHWLHQSGHPVGVVTPFSEGERFPEPFPVFRYPSIPVPTRKPYRFGLPYLWTPVVSQIHRTRFDIIHGHSPFSSGRMALSIARKQNVPFVMSFHSKFRDDFIHSVKSPVIADWMVQHIMEVFEAADEVWISQQGVEEVLRSYGYKGKTEVVEVGNDFANHPHRDAWRVQKRSELGFSDDIPLLLFVGQQIVEKNIPFIIDSLRLLQFPFRMIFVGEGYGLETFKKQVLEYGLEDRVSFTGSITNRDELVAYYAAADLFLFPSLYDTAGLVIREAAALRTPSLLIEGSTAAGAVTNEVNGFLAPNDVNAFAERLTEIISDKPMMERVALGAQQTLARSWEDIAMEVYDRYQVLIKRKQQSK